MTLARARGDIFRRLRNRSVELYSLLGTIDDLVIAITSGGEKIPLESQAEQGNGALAMNLGHEP